MSDPLLPDQSDDALAGHDTIYDRPEGNGSREVDVILENSDTDSADEPPVHDTPFRPPTGERVDPANDL